ncbi:MAG: flagellar type III secretion system pore protein FliP [Balneolales bacterium]|nr:flagellar type III secretion system pore protein FliP [Balneolales bacterium]
MTALRVYMLRLLWGSRYDDGISLKSMNNAATSTSTKYRGYFAVRTFLRNVFGFLLLFLALGMTIGASTALAQGIPQIDLSIGGEDGDLSLAIQALVIITVLSFGPAFVTMMTSFTRIIVVFFFLRMGLGTQQSPPNQVLIGLALFMTIFIMMPTFNQINEQAIQPYINEEMTQMEALNAAATPLKEFMVRQTRERDLIFFMDMAGINTVGQISDLPLFVVVPSYIMSELRIAFQIGFMIYLPFMVIDLVIASILLAMGIMFLPPVLVSLPFKILVFVLTDGWYLLVQSMVRSFN